MPDRRFPPPWSVVPFGSDEAVIALRLVLQL
jgi:hypothetical protein